MEKACLIVENTAKELCPVDTGQLRGSISHTLTNGGKTGEIGTNVEYAPYVEFGTGLFSSLGTGRTDVPWRYQSPDGKWHSTSGQKPQPYLMPSLLTNRDRILQIFKNEIRNQMRGK